MGLGLSATHTGAGKSESFERKTNALWVFFHNKRNRTVARILPIRQVCIVWTEPPFVTYSTGRWWKKKKKNQNGAEFLSSVKSLLVFLLHCLSICCLSVQKILHRFLSLPVCHPLSLYLCLSLSSVCSVTVTYNYSADLPPVSITSGVQRNCRSVEESIVGVPGGFLDNELAL